MVSALLNFYMGYLKTMLFAIEYKPKFQFPQKVFIFPHLIHHLQLASLVLYFPNQQITDFKLSYFIELIQPFLIAPLLNQMQNATLSYLAVVLLFSLQVALFIYMIFATALTQFFINDVRQRLILERRIDIVNSVLHWFFTFYPVFFIIMACICIGAVTCNPIGIFHNTDHPEYCSDSLVNFFSYTCVVLAIIQGMLLIYLLRNHRFAENNSFKRRFAILQIMNFIISFLMIIFHYSEKVNGKTQFSDSVKYWFAIIYGILSVTDQFYSCPYRDPFREPSLQFALTLEWVNIISMIFKFGNVINQEQLFFWIILPGTLFCALSDSTAGLFHEFAMTMYNSRTVLQEKYIILGVDQIYQYFLNFQQDDICKMRFYQQIINHNHNCNNAKCPSQKGRFHKINPNDKTQLHHLALNIILCIFKTAFQRSIIKQGRLVKPNFEQLQLQYISFLADINARPLIAYLELRAYQNNNNRSNSVYFKELTSRIAQELEQQILDLQTRMVRQTQYLLDQTQRIQEFSLNQQWKTINQFQYFLPKLIKLIDSKVRHWEMLIDGYPDLAPLQEQTLNLCAQIDDLQNELKQKINIPDFYFMRSQDSEKQSRMRQMSDEDQNVNILNLKLFSVLFSCIINDLDRSLFTEKSISDLVKDDRQKQVDIIDDQSLLQDKTVIILVSMVKNKGKICNKNLLTLTNFFEYDNIRDIEQKLEISRYLPPDMQELHRHMMENFLQRGYSHYFVRKIHSYYINKKGFLREVYLKIGNLFQEIDDFVLTGSLLKITSPSDVILFDQDGKILGTSEGIFREISRIAIDLTHESLIDSGYIFLFFPQILSILRTYSGSVNEVDYPIITDCLDYVYISENLRRFCQEFASIHAIKGEDQKASSYNLFNSFRSKSSRGSEKDSLLRYKKSALTESDISILGSPISMLSKDKSVSYLDFMEEALNSIENQDFQQQRMKIKYSINYRVIKGKKITYPYFEMTFETLNVFDKMTTQSSKMFLMQQVIRRTRNQINTGKTFTQSQQSKSRTEKNNNIAFKDPNQTGLYSEHQNTQILENDKDINKVQQANLEQIGSDMGSENPQTINFAASIPNQIKTPEKSEEGLKPKFQNPAQKGDSFMQNEQNAWEDLNNEISVLENVQASQIRLNQTQRGKAKDMEDIDSNDHIQLVHAQEDDQKEVKSSSFQRQQKKKDLLEVIQINKRNENYDNHDLNMHDKQSSKASSSRTDSSKSPFLIIRSMYTQDKFSGSILWITLINILLALTVFILLFFEVFIVQKNYDVLQSNLNYVQYPENLNYYFVKSTMLGWNMLEQNFQLVNYSDFINKQILLEIQSVKNSVDSNMNQIYRDIILYENDVITSDMPFQIINNLYSFSTNLDLTLLVEQFTSNTINLSNKIEEFIFGKKFDESAVSSLLFLRLNLPTINSFARSYVTFLNHNLLYYEDSIVNALTFLIVGEILFVTILSLAQVNMWYQIHDYMEKTLILTTRLSQEEAFELITSLRTARLILEDPSQVRWKATNFNSIMYEKRQLRKRPQEFDANQSSQAGSVFSGSTGKIGEKKLLGKQKRNYQNSSLTFRVYNLVLPQKTNYLISFIIWFLILCYLLGAIIMSIEQITKIKPALNLNLEMVQFKLQFDSLVTQAEILKTDGLMEIAIRNRFSLNNIVFQNKDIVQNFQTSFSGFQQQMTDIYNQLTSSSSLIEQQKTDLLIPFQSNLCDTMKDQIPFCQIGVMKGSLFENQIPQNFKDKYGTPFPSDDNYEFVSGGIVNIVQEFTKSILTYFDQELNGNVVSSNLAESMLNEASIQSFLSSQVHVTQFIEHFLQQGKVLSNIAYNMLYFNQETLTQVIQSFQLYIYLVGIFLVVFLSILFYKWIRMAKYKLHLTKLALILIPSENLLEQKTITAIKKLQFV